MSSENSSEILGLRARIKKMNAKCESAKDKLSSLGAEVQNISSSENEPERVRSITLKRMRRFFNPVTIPLSPGFTVIYAPNGTGKSTLCDALELVKYGKTPREGVYNVAPSETKDEKNLLSWSADSADAPSVEINLNENRQINWELGQSEQSTWAKHGYSTISRINLRNSIDQRSADRLDFVKSLLQFGEFDNLIADIESTEMGLDQDLEALKLDLESISKIAAELEFELEDLDYQQLKALAENESSEPEKSVRLMELISRDTETWDYLNTLQSDLMNAGTGEQPQAPASPEVNVGISGELAGALGQVLQIVHEGEECPVCKETILSQEMLDRLKGELEASDEMEDYLRRYSAYRRELETWRRRKAQMDGVFEKLKNRYGAKFSAVLEAASTISENVKATREFIAVEKATLDSQISHNKQLIKPSKRDQAQAILERTSFLGGNESEYSDRVNELRDYEVIKAELLAAKKLLKNIKTEFIRNQLEAIQEPVTRWWNLLSADSTGLELKIDLRSTGKNGGIDVYCVPSPTVTRTKSEEKKVRKHAMGVMSDSQLDLLALAFSFATLKSKIGRGMVWLDDPTDTLDSSNTKSFIGTVIPELLENGHQVVLCTHDREVVKECWAQYHEVMRSIAGEYSYENFSQINLDARQIANDEKTALFQVAVAPLNADSARTAFKSDFQEVQNSATDRLNLGNRLRLSNSLRRLAEFILCDLLEAIDPVLPSEISARSHSPWLGRKDGTLGVYRESLASAVEGIDKLIRIGKKNGNVSDKQAKGLLDATGSLGDCISRVETSILNEGSHADLTVPDFREIEFVWSAVDSLHNSYGLARMPSSSHLQIKGLKALYAGKNLDGVIQEVWTNLPESDSKQLFKLFGKK